MANWTLITLTIVAATAVVLVSSARPDRSLGHRKKPASLARLFEEQSGHRRPPQRPTHCLFGNQSFELEERWRPNLPPFGVYYCIRCKCEAYQRKNRIVARTECKNFKETCPKPTCDNPVLLPERCCKTCPGQDFAELEENLANRMLEQDDGELKEFSSLLTGHGLRTQMLSNNSSYVGRGYLSLMKRQLYYTIDFLGPDRPTYIRFTDADENILEELEVVPSPPTSASAQQHHQHQHQQHQQLVNSTKVCGVWRRIPKVYRAMLRKGRLYLSVAIDKKSETVSVISGRIFKNDMLHDEKLSAILKADSTPSADDERSNDDQSLRSGGGIAMISPMPNGVHVTFFVNNIFASNELRDIPVDVRLSTDDGILIAESVVILPKVNDDFNSFQVRFELRSGDEQLLTAGRLSIAVSTRDGNSIRGLVKPKTDCEAEWNRQHPSTLAPTMTSGHHNQRGINDLQRAYDDSNDNLIPESHKCYYEGSIYDDGSQWKSQHDNCLMCSCQRGRVKCEQEVCPTLDCSDPVEVPNACCKLCPGSGQNLTNSSVQKLGGCFFDGDKKFHVAGSRWHPYLPPFGFDKCSLCTCEPETEKIRCERNTNCPPLTCSEQEAYRENPMDCCKRCPNVVPVKMMVSAGEVGDQRASAADGDLLKGPNQLLAAGGCKFKGRVYANGDEWHPTVQPFGEVKCVKCQCKDSIYKCKRIVCPKIDPSCAIVVDKNNQCCPICVTDGNVPPAAEHPRRRGHTRVIRRKGKRRVQANN